MIEISIREYEQMRDANFVAADKQSAAEKWR